MYMQIDRYAHVAAAENLLFPFDELPHIDLDQPYWVQMPNQQLTIANKLYWGFSDDMLSFLEATVVVFFNKQMHEDLGIENLYGLVRDGTWTHDKMFDYAKLAVRDVDGDGAMTEADVWGIISEHAYIAQSLWVSAGIKLIEKDEEDMPYFAIPGNQRFFDLADRALMAFNTAGVFWEMHSARMPSFAGDGSMTSKLMFFRNGNALFTVGVIPEMIDLRDMPDDFGILQFPKYTADQPRYYTSVCGGFPFVIPTTISNPEIAGAVMEVMACEARNRIIPAYYESSLQHKFARDADTVEMLDLVFNTRVYDLGATIWPAPGTDFTLAFLRADNTFASIVEANEARYNQIMRSAIEAITEN
jgi:ABC-type glycerol-3-phosphate transport system substrate-binding protein